MLKNPPIKRERTPPLNPDIPKIVITDPDGNESELKQYVLHWPPLPKSGRMINRPPTPTTSSQRFKIHDKNSQQSKKYANQNTRLLAP